MRRLHAWFALAQLALTIPAARTEQLADLNTWLARVRGTIERTEPGELLAALKAAAPPQDPERFEAEATWAVEALVHHLNGRRPAYVDVVRDERYGTTFRRVDLSAWYQGFGFMFYGFDLFRLERGWVLTNFKLNNDLNQMMTRPFPN